MYAGSWDCTREGSTERRLLFSPSCRTTPWRLPCRTFRSTCWSRPSPTACPCWRPSTRGCSSWAWTTRRCCGWSKSFGGSFIWSRWAKITSGRGSGPSCWSRWTVWRRTRGECWPRGKGPWRRRWRVWASTDWSRYRVTRPIWKMAPPRISSLCPLPSRSSSRTGSRRTSWPCTRSRALESSRELTEVILEQWFPICGSPSRNFLTDLCTFPWFLLISIFSR